MVLCVDGAKGERVQLVDVPSYHLDASPVEFQTGALRNFPVVVAQASSDDDVRGSGLRDDEEEVEGDDDDDDDDGGSGSVGVPLHLRCLTSTGGVLGEIVKAFVTGCLANVGGRWSRRHVENENARNLRPISDAPNVTVDNMTGYLRWMKLNGFAATENEYLQELERYVYWQNQLVEVQDSNRLPEGLHANVVPPAIEAAIDRCVSQGFSCGIDENGLVWELDWDSQSGSLGAVNHPFRALALHELQRVNIFHAPDQWAAGDFFSESDVATIQPDPKHTLEVVQARAGSLSERHQGDERVQVCSDWVGRLRAIARTDYRFTYASASDSTGGWIVRDANNDAEIQKSYDRDCLRDELPLQQSGIAGMIGVLVDRSEPQRPFCSGVRIAERIVLTAMHCLSDFRISIGLDSARVSRDLVFQQYSDGRVQHFDIEYVELNEFFLDSANVTRYVDAPPNLYDFVFLVLTQNDVQAPRFTAREAGDYTELLIRAYNRSARNWQAVERPGSPWHASLRHDDLPSCIVIPSDVNQCLFHGCQTEPIASGSGIFARTDGSGPVLVGLHIGSLGGLEGRVRRSGEILGQASAGGTDRSHYRSHIHLRSRIEPPAELMCPGSGGFNSLNLGLRVTPEIWAHAAQMIAELEGPS